METDRDDVESKPGLEGGETATRAGHQLVVRTMTETMRDRLVWTDRVSIPLGQKAVVRRTRPPGMHCNININPERQQRREKNKA
jgi:hypothetical protein